MKKSALATHVVKTAIGLLLIAISALLVSGTAQAKTGEIVFPRPPEIEKAVDFWTRIYSEVDSNSGFIHDSRALDVIYEVYPLSTNASLKRQHRRIRQRIQPYKRLLRKIAETPESNLNREERRVERLWGSNASASQLRDAEKRIRFQRGQSDRMKKGLKRAARYEIRIREILRDQGVPEQLAADPADYLVGEDDTIEVQVGEALGHYAHWLNLPTQQLRALNGMRYGKDVIVGSRLRLAFSIQNAMAFEQKHENYHAESQNRFFESHRIVGVQDHALTDGDNLWELATKTYQIPLWLLRQYNPDLTFDTVLSLSSSLRVPVVQLNDASAMLRPGRIHPEDPVAPRNEWLSQTTASTDTRF